MALAAITNENVENGIDSDIVDNTHYDWTNFQSNYDLDAKVIFDNDDKADAFVCMVYTSDPGGEDDDNEGEFQEHQIPNPTPSNNDTIIDSKAFINDDPFSDTVNVSIQWSLAICDV